MFEEASFENKFLIYSSRTLSKLRENDIAFFLLERHEVVFAFLSKYDSSKETHKLAIVFDIFTGTPSKTMWNISIVANLLYIHFYQWLAKLFGWLLWGNVNGKSVNILEFENNKCIRIQFKSLPYLTPRALVQKEDTLSTFWNRFFSLYTKMSTFPSIVILFWLCDSNFASFLRFSCLW